jgi:hypothetical protein
MQVRGPTSAKQSLSPRGSRLPPVLSPKGEPREPSAGTQHAMRSGRQRKTVSMGNERPAEQEANERTNTSNANKRQKPRRAMHVQPITGGRGAARVIMEEATVAYDSARTTEVYDNARTTDELRDPKPKPRRRCGVGPEEVPSTPHNQAGTAGGARAASAGAAVSDGLMDEEHVKEGDVPLRKMRVGQMPRRPWGPG